MDADAVQIERAKEVGAERVELYTEPYARAYGTEHEEVALEQFVVAASAAGRAGLGVNAGHDLNLQNLRRFCRAVPDVLEVSIGHALFSYAFEVGLEQAVTEYLGAMR